MKRLLSTLFPVALLVNTACQKNDPTPAAPSILGRWEQKELIVHRFDAAGQPQPGYTEVAETFYWDFTPDSLHTTSILHPELPRSGVKLTRANDSLFFGSARTKIMEVTEHKLLLSFRSPAIPGYKLYHEETVVFSR
ncbi:hypothetical protein [Hymenobacter tenuis]